MTPLALECIKNPGPEKNQEEEMRGPTIFGLMVLTLPMVFTSTHGIVIFLARTHGIDMDSW